MYCTFSSQLHTCTSGRFSAKRVVSFCLGSGAVPKKRRLAFSEKYKGAFSLIIHEAGMLYPLVLQSVCRGIIFCQIQAAPGCGRIFMGTKQVSELATVFVECNLLEYPFFIGDPVISFLRNVGIEDRVGYDV